VLSLLVVGQVTLSLVVLVGAGLFAHSLGRMRDMPLGFRPDNLALMSLDLGLQGYDDQRGRQFLDALLDEASALPGVRSATVTVHVPFDYGIQISDVAADGEIAGSKDGYVKGAFTVVGRRFFETAGAAIVRGRALDETDLDTSRRVAVVNETMARTLWPGADPVGRRFRVGRDGDWVEVVGMAADGKYVMMAEPPRSYFYLPLSQNYRSPVTLMVRSEGDPAALVPRLQALLRRRDADLPVFNVRTMEGHIRESVFGLMPLRMAAALAAGQGLLALLLAVMGLYAVVSYSTNQRVHEIGIRVALGARPADVLRVVVSRGLGLTAAGLGLGFVFALAFGFVLSHVLYGVERVAAEVLAPVTLLLLGVSAVACYLPARRALHVDPAAALRHD
jgi:predicted permease